MTIDSLEESPIDRETLLDITVNVIPIGILLFFVVLFTLVQPWGYDPFYILLGHGLTIFPILVLLLVTYVSAKVIARDEAH